MSLKVAIVGCGKIADGHVEEIAKLDTAVVVAVCDSEPLMAEQLAVRYGLRAHYDDFEKLLQAEKPDVVHVTTPPQSHRELALLAMEAGCHVFVEKPLGPTLDDAEAILASAKSRSRQLTVGYTYMFDPPALALRRLVRENVIGDPVHIESFYGYNIDGVFGKAVVDNPAHWVHGLPGSLLQNNIDHLLYKLTEFIEDPYPSIHALAYTNEMRSGEEGEAAIQDELRVLVKGRNVSGYATLSSHARPVGHFVRLYGTKNTAHVDYVSRTVTLDADAHLPSAIGRVLPAFGQSWRFFREGARNVYKFARSDFHFFAGLNRLLDLYYRSILDGTDPPISYETILKVAWMTETIVEQTTQSPSGDAK